MSSAQAFRIKTDKSATNSIVSDVSYTVSDFFDDDRELNLW